MPSAKSLEELRRLKNEVLEKRKGQPQAGRVRVVVGMGTCGIASGARETMKAILDAIESENLDGIVVTQTGCIGRCEWEPIVQVAVGDEPQVTYGHVSVERAKKIVKEHIVGGRVVAELVI
jgi:NADP-reducing hydrogenase subunit HndB